MGRRKFIKTISSTLLGIAAPNILKVRSSLGNSEKTTNLDYRTLGKTEIEGNSCQYGGDELQRSGCAASGL